MSPHPDADAKGSAVEIAKQIVIDIVGDSSKFRGATDDATKSSGKFGAGMAVMAGFAGGFAFKAVDAIMGVGMEIVNLGPKMEAMDAKAQTVFGASLGGVKAWADVNAAAMGLTSREAVGLAAGMGDLLIPMGFTRDEAAKMSTNVVGLSGALSEWTGGTKSAAEVSDILQKGLLGERDGLKALGISISDADVKQQLLKDGTSKLTGAALAQATANATLTLYTAKTTDAQAAYEKGTAKGIRAQHEMEAQLNTVKETMAKALMPILQAVTGWLAKNLPGAIKFLGDAFNAVAPIIGAYISVLISIAKVVIPIVIAAVGFLVKAFNVIKTVIGAVGKSIGEVFSGIVSTVKGAINLVIGVINGIIGGINSIKFEVDIPGLGKRGFAGFNLGYLPYMHAGGIVPGATGSNVLALLQAGERVVPVGGKSGAITLNFYGPVVSDVRELSRLLAHELRIAGA